MLFFASEIRDLLAALPRRPGPDPLAVAHYISSTGLPERRTMYEGIERLLPGELIELSNGGWKRRRWWWPKPRAVAGEPVDVLQAEMRGAVERALVRASSGGVLLSGGFDSGSVAVLAGQASRVPLRAYSSVFPRHPAIDESERIAATRHAAGLEGFEQQYSGGRSALEAAGEFIAEWRVPPVSPNGLFGVR